MTKKTVKSEKLPDKQRDYPVGDKKPPKEHQFKPGESGNPEGPPVRRTQLWTYFCRYMALTDAKLAKLDRSKLTQAQQVALRLVENAKEGKYSGSERLELSTHFRAVWGGVSCPGKRPGFAVVVGMGHEPHFDSHDIFLLDEYETFDLRKLVRQCGALDVKYAISTSSYRPGDSGRWIGDDKNDAASRFIQEMNDESRENPTGHREWFSLSGTLMLEMENLYPYIIPQIKSLLTPERRMLFLKGSKIVSYLSEIEEGEIAELELGAYPAVEALAFVTLELPRWRKYVGVQRPKHSSYRNDALTRGMKLWERLASRKSKFR